MYFRYCEVLYIKSVFLLTLKSKYLTVETVWRERSPSSSSVHSLKFSKKRTRKYWLLYCNTARARHAKAKEALLFPVCDVYIRKNCTPEQRLLQLITLWGKYRSVQGWYSNWTPPPKKKTIQKTEWRHICTSIYYIFQKYEKWEMAKICTKNVSSYNKTLAETNWLGNYPDFLVTLLILKSKYANVNLLHFLKLRKYKLIWHSWIF